MSGTIHDLNGDFPKKTAADWREMSEAALNGRDFDRTLVRTTPAGLARGPVWFDEERARPQYILPKSQNAHLPWEIVQTVSTPSVDAANTAVLEDLQGGVTAMVLKLSHDGRAGIAVAAPDDLSAILRGVDLTLAPVWLEAGSSVEQAGWLEACLTSVDGAGDALRGGFGLAPDDPEAFEFAARTQAHLPETHAICVDARAIHDAGGHEVQELAFAAAGTACAMRGLLSAGLNPDQAARRITLTLAVDTDIHLSISKLRAARRIWAAIMEAFDVSQDSRRGHLLAVTSFRMMSRLDPWTNLVRTATAGFAGATGTADALTIRPLTDPIGRAGAFARRVARNLHIVLQEEAHVGRVADPAGGAFLHEALSETLAQRAWGAFQTLESEGGYTAAAPGSRFANDLEQARSDAAHAYAIGAATLIGTTTYAQVETRKADALDDAWQANLPEAAFPAIRFAEPFEALRDRATKTAASGKVPAAFLATLGERADFSPRATFAARRMAVGGIETAGAEVHASLDAIVDAFRQSGAGLAVICGADEAYASDAENLARALRAGGAQAVWLAGPPQTALAGIDHFIHARSNVLDDIEAAFDAMEAAP